MDCRGRLIGASSTLRYGVRSWSADRGLMRQDIQWLDRLTYGPTTVTVDEYVKLGRRRFLNEQLHPSDVRLPQPAAAQIAALEISQRSTAELLATVYTEQQRIN